MKPVAGAQDYAADSRRKQVLWLALSLIGLLGLALVLTVCYGTEITSSDYGEPMLLIGLLAFLTCTVAYFADKEREHRRENGNLLRRLHETALALDARVARLNNLCETSTLLTGNLDIEHISDLVVEALMAQVQADAASLVLLDKVKGEYFHRRSTGPLAQVADGRDRPEQIATDAAEAAPSMRALSADKGIARQLEAWGKMRAAITAPIHASELIGGALAAIREDSFSTEDLNLLTTLANMAGKAIESAELHEQLRQSYFRTLHVLARSLSARDPYSAAHGEAVTLLAVGIAEKLGLGGEVIEALRAYGPLHDLGKIGIPDSVLLKRGPLTDEEIELCRQHTVIGESIIRPLKPGPTVLAMIRNHHERWDGSGYPDGLRGEQIPMVARIVAAADAFHAIVSHRSYRAGAIPFNAVREIKTLSGVQFEPAVVEALAELWDGGELADFSIRVSEPIELSSVSALPAALCAPPAVLH